MRPPQPPLVVLLQKGRCRQHMSPNQVCFYREELFCTPYGHHWCKAVSKLSCVESPSASRAQHQAHHKQQQLTSMAAAALATEHMCALNNTPHLSTTTTDMCWYIRWPKKKVRKTIVLHSVSFEIYSIKFGPHMRQRHVITTRSTKFKHVRHSLEKGS